MNTVTVFVDEYGPYSTMTQNGPVREGITTITASISGGRNSGTLTASSSTSATNTSTSTPALTNVSSPKLEGPGGKSTNAGAIAGSLIGGLAIGALVAFLIAFLVIRRKYNSRLAAHKEQMQKEQIERGFDSFNDKDVTQTLIYADPAKDHQIQEAQKRIKALEIERNAASAFGNKLDGKSERDLLSGTGYGLSVLNERINQLAMTLTVKASGSGQLGTSNGSTEKSEQISKLYARGPAFVRDHFEDCIRHAINVTLYERVGVPFCFEASEQGRSTGYTKIAKEILRDNDQAMYARWRSMTHTTLRISAEKRGKQSQSSASKQVQSNLLDTIIDILLYAGMEPNANAASKTATNDQSRIGEIVQQCSKLMTIIREEMSSNDYALEMVSLQSNNLTKSLGLSSKTKTDTVSRILLEPVAAKL